MDFKSYISKLPEIKLTIALDMDGVLCDFAGAFQKIAKTKLMPNEYEDKYGSDEFWDIVTKGEKEFWSNMDWMPDGKVLWNYVKRYNPIIISAPSKINAENCVGGKVQWLKKNIPQLDPLNYSLSFKDTNVRVYFSSDKYQFIMQNKDLKYLRGEYKTRLRRKENVDDLFNAISKLERSFILIDDTDKKIDMWNKAGGVGILHTSANETISQLQSLGI